MLIENTLSKLQEMKLTTMAKAFREQLTDTNIISLPFEDRFGLLVDQEWTSRKNNHLKRLIKQAKFSDTGACVEDIEYHADRNLDKTQIARLSTCDFITEHHNLLLLGATGSGKTYIACALGMSAISLSNLWGTPLLSHLLFFMAFIKRSIAIEKYLV